jgi:transcriptional regulator with XRE-family HTH domain
MQETLGEYIERKRKALGLSQRALAKKAKISHNTLHRIELDVGKPSSATLDKLADALGVPMSQLTNVMQGRVSHKEKEHPIIHKLDQLPLKIQQVAEKMIDVLLEEFKSDFKK